MPCFLEFLFSSLSPIRISVTFVDKDGDEHQLNVPIGMSMLEAAHENDIELEGKAVRCFSNLFCMNHLKVTHIVFYFYSTGMYLDIIITLSDCQ